MLAVPFFAPTGRVLAGSSDTVIDVWYGTEQTFGNPGVAQRWVNVLGTVSDPDGIAWLRYSLNGGPLQNLGLGPDTRRLLEAGDFNIEIDPADLLDGANELAIVARDNTFAQTTGLVTVNYIADDVWPLPYSVDWNSVSNLQDAAQVVDGQWEVTPTGLRQTVLGYDRTIAFGDASWTDYEASIPITIHSIQADFCDQATGPCSTNGCPWPSVAPAVAVLVRWPGHSAWDAKQPRWGWEPAGAGVWYDLACDGPLRLSGDDGLEEIDPLRSLAFDTQYIFKIRVESAPGVGTYYATKVWEQGQAEPVNWDLEGYEGLTDVPAGSCLIVAHHADITVGNLTIEPLQDITPPVISDVVVSTTTDMATITWTTDEPATSDLDYGLTETYTNSNGSAALETNHSVVLDGLTDATLYHFRISGQDAEGNTGQTSDQTFTTASCASPVDESFDANTCGADPANWIDTGAGGSLSENDALFAVVCLPGDHAFATTSGLNDVHSHYVDGCSASWSSYTYSGRMMFDSFGGDIGVTMLSQYPTTGAYYSLRNVGTSGFRVGAQGTAISGGVTDSGVVPSPGAWYRFRCRVRDIGTHTEIQARIWPDGDGEPNGWTIDCYDDSVGRLTAGTVGVYASGAGSQYWDDLRTCAADCNSNGIPDECDLDCNTNGIPDDCEAFTDCNTNAIPDECELAGNDCDVNGVPDECDIDCNLNGTPDACESFADCNSNAIPDECELAGNDCDSNSVPDECDPDCDSSGTPDACESFADCNSNSVPDQCELAANDCNTNGVPDECDADCDTNGIPDTCEAYLDCNSNAIPDRCELIGNDCNTNGVPDECDADCDTNGIPDACEVFADCNSNAIPDQCELAGNDCNSNGVPDECDADCDTNGIPDSCEAFLDCNSNAIPDQCELAGNDCDTDGVPDECEPDCNTNGTPDACEAYFDCNLNLIPDMCELAGNDCNTNGVPDECDTDCDTNGIPDDCEAHMDCNTNGTPDVCDLLTGASADANLDNIPDECQVRNLTQGTAYTTISGAMNEASNEDQVLAPASRFVAEPDIDFLDRSVDLVSAGPMIQSPGGLITLADGSSLSTAPNQTMSIGGELLIGVLDEADVAAGTFQVESTGRITVEASAGLEISAPINVLDGSAQVDPNATLAFSAPLELAGTLTLHGGVVVADTLTVAGINSLFEGYGEIVGSIQNDANTVMIADTQLLGDLINNGVTTVQNGTLTITGSIVDSGQIIGDISATLASSVLRSATGLTVLGDYSAGPDATLRMPAADLTLKLGGDFDCAIDSETRFTMASATLQAIGLGSSIQQFEAMSADIGPYLYGLNPDRPGGIPAGNAENRPHRRSGADC